MGYYRYDDDAVKMSVANYIISGALLVAGIIFFIFTFMGVVDYAPLYAIFIGLAFFNLVNVKNIYKDYDMSNKFVRWLLGFATFLGALLILAGVGASVSCDIAYVKVFAFSVLIGILLKVFITNIYDFIPAFENPENEFFKYCSMLIFVAGTLIVFSILFIFFDFYFVLLLFGNWFLVYFILGSFRSWLEEKKVGNLVWAIIALLAGIGLNLPLALAVNGLSNAAFNINEANLFNLAANLYFALAFVMGIGFTFLTMIEFVKDNMTEQGVQILLMVIPGLAFGLQFLAFFYFDAFLIVAGVVLVLIALVVLLFKAFMAIIRFIGDGLVSAGQAIWYIISFKWITNQVDVIFGDKKPKPQKQPQGETDCYYCEYFTNRHPVTDEECMYCMYHQNRCSFSAVMGHCDKFKRK